ncbi:MAG: endonuclease/exonuclease/phosphatase family protein [Acidimicrobiales bacterium]
MTAKTTPARRLLGLGGWALVAPSAVLAASRGVRHQRHIPVLILEALGPVWLLPTLAAAGLAAAARRPALGAVAAALAGLRLSWLTPEIRPRPVPADDSDGTARLRLYSHNVLFTNTHADRVAAEIVTADPDVVVLQEVSPPIVAALRSAGILDRYPHQWLDPRTNGLGTAILSRDPLEDARQWWCAGQLMAQATVVVDGHRVTLYDVHTRAPTGFGDPARWATQLGALAEMVAAEPGPLVVAGDFNATSGHRAFRDLLSAGLADAHVAGGRWWAATWPCDLRPLPSFARLDHILVSPHLDVLGVWEGRGAGSDHRPVIVDLALPSPVLCAISNRDG